MKVNKENIKAKIKLWLKLIFNWRFLICFGLAWLITNGWSYILIILGTTLNITWMLIAGSAYLTFLWLPITPEKILTVAIALFLTKILFKKHSAELEEQIRGTMKSNLKADTHTTGTQE